MSWTVPKLWPGQTCFIIGGGPSVKDLDLTLIQDRRIIGVNNAFELGVWVDVCFFGDCRWQDWNWKTLKDFPGLIASICTRAKNKPGVLAINRNMGKYGIEKRPTHICWNSNSGAAAINLAYHFGVKTVVLLGFDMQIKDGVHHWHDRHITNGDHRPPDNIYTERFLPAFPAIARDAKKLGLEIINANLDSKIDVFPKVELTEYLASESKTY